MIVLDESQNVPVHPEQKMRHKNQRYALPFRQKEIL
jgi:hypothetical protein